MVMVELLESEADMSDLDAIRQRHKKLQAELPKLVQPERVFQQHVKDIAYLLDRLALVEKVVDIDRLVARFLAWPLPDSVCSDLCATKQGYPHRSGTNLLSAAEAKQMFEYLLNQALAAYDAGKDVT